VAPDPSFGERWVDPAFLRGVGPLLPEIDYTLPEGVVRTGRLRCLDPNWPAHGRTDTQTREKSLTSALSALSLDEIDNLAAALDTMLTTVTQLRAEERSARTNDRPQPWLCRLCDFAACGRSEGNCPVNNAVTTRNRS
jgi:hypothetical protein